MTKEKALSILKLIWNIIKFILPLLTILMLLICDVKEILLKIPNIDTLAKNIKFINDVITHYLLVIIIIVVIWCWIFIRNHMNISVPKISFAGIEINLKNIDGIVKANIRNYLNTKRTLFAIDFKIDNFDDVFESYHQIYEFLRTQMGYYEDMSISNNELYKEIDGMVTEINKFLSTNQTNYRRWYKFENSKQYVPIDVLQQKYPGYESLKKSFTDINKKMKKMALFFNVDTEKWH